MSPPPSPTPPPVGAAPLVVMGVSGSGKTSVARELAGLLGRAFADADDLHPPANVAKMAAGTPLTDEDRAPWLHAVGAWLAEHDADGAVAACSALRRAHRDVLRRHAPDVRLVHLTADRATLAARIADRPGHFMPVALLDSQLAALEPPDADERAVTVVATGTAAQSARAALRRLTASR